MANDPKTDALRTLRSRLAAHARDPRAAMLGLGPTLQALQGAIDELDLRTGSLAVAYLLLLDAYTAGSTAKSQYVRLTMHPAQLDALAAMNDHAGALARHIASRVTGAV